MTDPLSENDYEIWWEREGWNGPWRPRRMHRTEVLKYDVRRLRHEVVGGVAMIMATVVITVVMLALTVAVIR